MTEQQEVKTTNAPINDGKLQIIYKNNAPYGIRNSGGFLFLFVKIQKYSGQEERYRKEVEEQFQLADFLLAKMKEI